MTENISTLNSERELRNTRAYQKTTHHTVVITKTKANLSQFDALEMIERQRQLHEGTLVLPRVYSGKGIKVSKQGSKQGSNNSGGSGQVNIKKNTTKRSDGSTKQFRIKQHAPGARSANQRIGRSQIIKSKKAVNLTAP